MITTDDIKEVKKQISLLVSVMQKEDFDGYESTVLIDIKPSSFEFVMNQIVDILNEV